MGKLSNAGRKDSETGVISEEFDPIGLILTGRIFGPQRLEILLPMQATLYWIILPYCTRLSRLTCTCYQRST